MWDQKYWVQTKQCTLVFQKHEAILLKLMEFATWFTIVVLNPSPTVCQKIHLLLHACTKLSCTWDFLLTLWAALAYLYPAFLFFKCLTSDSNSYIFSMVQLLSLHCWRWPSFQCLHLFLFFFIPSMLIQNASPLPPPPHSFFPSPLPITFPTENLLCWSLVVDFSLDTSWTNTTRRSSSWTGWCFY